MKLAGQEKLFFNFLVLKICAGGTYTMTNGHAKWYEERHRYFNWAARRGFILSSKKAKKQFAIFSEIETT